MVNGLILCNSYRHTCSSNCTASHPWAPGPPHSGRPLLQGNSQLVPLLQRTGMDIALQAARFLDPARPVVRLHPSIPVLHFHLRCGVCAALCSPSKALQRLSLLISGPSPLFAWFPHQRKYRARTVAPLVLSVLPSCHLSHSGQLCPAEPRFCLHIACCSPGRVGRMLRVIRAALPASEEEQAAAAGTAGSGGVPQAAGSLGADKELWRQHAEYEGSVRVLTWAGLGRTSVAWCPRHGIIYQVGVGGALHTPRRAAAQQLPASWPLPGLAPLEQCLHVKQARMCLAGLYAARTASSQGCGSFPRSAGPQTPAANACFLSLQGKLYLYEGPQPGARQLAAEAVWPDRRIVRVPPDKIGGAEHVVAVCPGRPLCLEKLCTNTYPHIRPACGKGLEAPGGQ